jgi:hypothetical protein
MDMQSGTPPIISSPAFACVYRRAAPKSATDAYVAVPRWGLGTSPDVDDYELNRRRDDYDLAGVQLLALIREA